MSDLRQKQEFSFMLGGMLLVVGILLLVGSFSCLHKKDHELKKNIEKKINQ